VSKTHKLLDLAFGPAQNPSALRYAFTVAQWVVLAQRFGIATAKPPFETRRRHGWSERQQAKL
jgi:asparagine synthase (glutamine-hydrolysing)